MVAVADGLGEVVDVVLVQGRKPVAVQRRIVTGDTPSRRAACWTLRSMRTR
jgi:hypothetical protein